MFQLMKMKNLIKTNKSICSVSGRGSVTLALTRHVGPAAPLICLLYEPLSLVFTLLHLTFDPIFFLF